MPAGARGGCNAGLIPGRRTTVGARAAQLILHVYQAVLSPWLGPACRFEPSCSRYAAAAIERHGVLRGCHLALRRIARCNPLGGCGYDPVP